MELSYALAQIFGIYWLISAFFLVIRREAALRLFRSFAKNEMMQRAAGLIEILAGLLILFFHTTWSGWPTIISLIGVLAVAEGLYYSFMPHKIIYKSIMKAVKPAAFNALVAVFAVLGLFLVFVGFGG